MVQRMFVDYLALIRVGFVVVLLVNHSCVSRQTTKYRQRDTVIRSALMGCPVLFEIDS